jgi:hypothetical protein
MTSVSHKMTKSQKVANSEDDAFVIKQGLKYVAAFKNIKTVVVPEMRLAVKFLNSAAWDTSVSTQERTTMAVGMFENQIMELSLRPSHVEFSEFDEIPVLGEVLCLAWKLTPDCWAGLQVLLDLHSEKLLLCALNRLDPLAIETLKAIAMNTIWPSDPFLAGPITASLAMTVLERITTQVDFDDCSLIFTERRVCDAPNCPKIETKLATFKHCAKCRKTCYCSKNCQKKAWSLHKSIYSTLK